MIRVYADNQNDTHSAINVEVNGYDKIAAMVMLDRIHELLPIEDI